jgi:hypothetical protein
MQTARAAALAPQRPALRASSSSSSRRCALVVRSSSVAGAPGAPQLPSAGLLRLTAAAAALVQRGAAAAKAAAAQAARQVAEEDLNAQIKASVKQMRMLAVVAPLAAVSGGADTFMIITRAVASFIKLYLLLLFVRVLLSWFPTFQWWEQQPFAALRQVRAQAAAHALCWHPALHGRAKWLCKVLAQCGCHCLPCCHVDSHTCLYSQLAPTPPAPFRSPTPT